MLQLAALTLSLVQAASVPGPAQSVTVHFPALPPVPEALRESTPPLRPGADPALDTWWVMTTPEMPVLGGSWRWPEGAEEVPVGRDWTLPLPQPGTWLIHAGARRGSIAYRLYREVEVHAGETLELALPEPSAHMRGSLVAWTPKSAGGGPRVRLVPLPGSARSAQWTLLCRGLPRIAPLSEVFELPHLPAGRYAVFDHLEDSGRLQAERWGGQEVLLTAGTTVKLRDFGWGEPAALPLEVLHPCGASMEGALVRVLDPLHAPWNGVERRPFCVGTPPPTPPERRLENGRAVLPSIRAGWLELEVACDCGATQRFLRRVAPPRTLRLVFDD